MREISVRHSGAGELMTGPDGAVYFIRDGSPAVHSAACNAIRGAASSVASAGLRVPEVVSIRDDLRAKLGNLPQLPVWPC